MTIANALRKISPHTLTDKVSAKVGRSVRYATVGGQGLAYLTEVVRVFVENLPEDDDEIKLHVRKRNDEKWGLDLPSVFPYRSAEAAIDLGLLYWEYKPESTQSTTAALVLFNQLKVYTDALVEVLCEEAIKAYEDGPEAQYVAHINIPGYSPMADEPAEFETAQEAWEWLADERRMSEDSAEGVEDGDDDKDEESTTLQRLVANMRADKPICDVVYGPTPGYDGDHDLGLAYSVVPIEN